METKLIVSWLYDKAARAHDHSYARMLNMTAKRLRELDEKQRWIPVTERLPEKTIDVLLYFGGKYKNQAVGFWHGCEECGAVYWCAYTDDGFYTDCDYKPTHWMPLPEPPKED